MSCFFPKLDFLENLFFKPEGNLSILQKLKRCNNRLRKDSVKETVQFSDDSVWKFDQWARKLHCHNKMGFLLLRELMVSLSPPLLGKQDYVELFCIVSPVFGTILMHSGLNKSLSNERIGVS